MHMVDLILKKRDGGRLTREEIEYFIQGVTDGSIPDYQISALLMAMYFQTPDPAETAALTMAMAHSGTIFDLSSIPGVKVDKHSTGGVADTTTLILAPLVAACGVPVIKMSGRGLGFTGGTLDKLESIPGFHIGISEAEALAFAAKSGIVIMSQTATLDPADKKLYALRDVTGTIDHISLIASSIMSKKIAAGADAIVLDVKCGSGAFMKDADSARALAREMAAIGKAVGRKVTAVISSMDQPLGLYIGNALEVMEAIQCLKGQVAGDLLTVSLALGSQMLLLSGRAATLAEGEALLRENIRNGKGLEKFRELICQQQGDPSILEDVTKLPLAPCRRNLTAAESGYITAMDTAAIGRASLETGAGRATKEDPIDYGAGIIMAVRIGDKVSPGQTLATLYAATPEKCAAAAEILRAAVCIGPEKPETPPLILDVISSEEVS